MINIESDSLEHRELVDFCIKELLPEVEALKIEINLEKGFRGIAQSEAALEIDEGVYIISIDSDIDLLQQMLSVTHEMVHVSQHHTGRLEFPSDDDVFTFIWLGNPINITDYKEYNQIPWEKEAYDKERSLLEEWSRIWAKEKDPHFLETMRNMAKASTG